MKFLNTLTLLTILISVVEAQGQDTLQYKDSPLDLSIITLKHTLNYPDCPFTKENAIRDIKNDSVSLVIHGGFIGFQNDSIKSDYFQARYNVSFYYQGCISEWKEGTCETYEYNEKILNYLVQKYGEQVRTAYKDIWNKE